MEGSGLHLPGTAPTQQTQKGPLGGHRYKADDLGAKPTFHVAEETNQGEKPMSGYLGTPRLQPGRTQQGAKTPPRPQRWQLEEPRSTYVPDVWLQVCHGHLSVPHFPYLVGLL